MESALVVSSSEEDTAIIVEMAGAVSIGQTIIVKSCGEARRLLVERDFDAVIINMPLRDETGESLCRHIASKGISQVILLVRSEFFDAVSAVCEDDGILTIAKPLDRALFWQTLKLAGAAQSRLRRVQAENSELKQKIEDIRIIDRAKCVLISYLKLSEQEAHRFIEKQAMDMRSSRRAVAEGILRTYDAGA
jgi:response regulator NasT